MTKESISFLAALLVLLVFAFLSSIKYVGRINLQTRMQGVETKRGFPVSKSRFGRFYGRYVQTKVTEDEIHKMARLFGVDMDYVQKQIKLAGKEADISAIEIVMLKLLGIIGILIFGGAAFIARSTELGIFGVFVFLALFLLPTEKITDEIKKREEQIRLELPLFIEQTYMCTEAGATLRDALETVAYKTGGSLGEAFIKAFTQGAYSGRWEQGLTNMAEEMRIEPLEDFVHDILIAHEKGVAINTALREEVTHIQVIDRNKKREAINALPTKMFFYMMVFFLLPTMIIVLMPAMLLTQSLL